MTTLRAIIATCFVVIGCTSAGYAWGHSRSHTITKSVPVYITKEAPTTTTELKGPSYRCIVDGWPIIMGIEQAAHNHQCERIS
jgi:hypothetical protein